MLKKIYLLCWAGLLLLAFGCQGNAESIDDTSVETAASPTPLPVWTPAPNSLYVDTTKTEGEISPFVYGTNYGPWVTVPFDLQDEAYQAGIRFLRFPGGNWGDLNNLRPTQIDQFIDLAEQMDAEPSISVRLRGGTPEAAANLVRYANIENDYDVRYWSIGNEPSLYDDYDTERYNREWREFALAMRAVDPNILLLGPETHQYTSNPAANPKDENGRDWVDAFLEANGDLVDIVAVHRYPFPTSPTSSPSIEDLRQNSREWNAIIPTLRAQIEQTTGRDLPIAITEVNSNWSGAIGGEATPDSFFNAIWWGDVLGRMIANDVDIVAHFVLQTSDAAGGWGLLARYDVRPSYYVYQLYQQFGQTRLNAQSDIPYLSIYAARRDDGAVTLMVVNLADEAQTAPLTLAGAGDSLTADVWRLDREHNAAPLEPLTWNNGTAVSFPGQSMTLLVVQADSE